MILLIKYLNLHLCHQFAVFGLLEGHAEVEGAADTRVSHHWGEDIRAVDLLALKTRGCYRFYRCLWSR